MSTHTYIYVNHPAQRIVSLLLRTYVFPRLQLRDGDPIYGWKERNIDIRITKRRHKNLLHRSVAHLRAGNTWTMRVPPGRYV